MSRSYLDPSYVIGLFPDLLPVKFRQQLDYPETVPILQGKELDLAVLALIKYLTEVSLYYFLRLARDRKVKILFYSSGSK